MDPQEVLYELCQSKSGRDLNADLKAANQYGRSQQNPTSRQGPQGKGNPVSQGPELPPPPPPPPKSRQEMEGANKKWPTRPTILVVNTRGLKRKGPQSSTSQDKGICLGEGEEPQNTMKLAEAGGKSKSQGSKGESHHFSPRPPPTHPRIIKKWRRHV